MSISCCHFVSQSNRATAGPWIMHSWTTSGTAFNQNTYDDCCGLNCVLSQKICSSPKLQYLRI